MSSSNKTFSVTELNSIVRGMLETRIGEVRVKGEISNFSKPSSGHMYFTLKDSKAQIRCAFFRNRSLRLKLKPANGQEVVAIGRLSLYEARGEYQMIVESLEEAGEGALQLKFEQLKQKLFAEGLFDAELKRELPKYPRQIAIITSATGAALQDILHVLQRRYSALSVLIYPAAVQGDSSESELIGALKSADQNHDNEVILFARGGGSIEDLWSFNSEKLARLIVQTRVPVVTGVGHEIDFTIADFAADHRAPTPSAAAELISPESTELLSKFSQLRSSLKRNLLRRLEQESQSTDWLTRQVRGLHPKRRLFSSNQINETLTERLNSSFSKKLGGFQVILRLNQLRLVSQAPKPQLSQITAEQRRILERLKGSIDKTIDSYTRRESILNRTLDNLSPLNTLKRGYAIVYRDKNGTIVKSPSSLIENETLTIKLRKGLINTIVKNND